jgi:hypothetical protein
MTANSRMPRPKLIAAALRGLWEIALARHALYRIGPTGVQQRNAEAARCDSSVPEAKANRHCHSVSFIIPRIARRVPWRADCLVQALAGQRWLTANGIASEIVVGTARSNDGHFEAHAWLRRGEQVILGGDIARFAPLLTPDATVFIRN